MPTDSEPKLYRHTLDNQLNQTTSLSLPQDWDEITLHFRAILLFIAAKSRIIFRSSQSNQPSTPASASASTSTNLFSWTNQPDPPFPSPQLFSRVTATQWLPSHTHSKPTPLVSQSRLPPVDTPVMGSRRKKLHFRGLSRMFEKPPMIPVADGSVETNRPGTGVFKPETGLFNASTVENRVVPSVSMQMYGIPFSNHSNPSLQDPPTTATDLRKSRRASAPLRLGPIDVAQLNLHSPHPPLPAPPKRIDGSRPSSSLSFSTMSNMFTGVVSRFHIARELPPAPPPSRASKRSTYTPPPSPKEVRTVPPPMVHDSRSSSPTKQPEGRPESASSSFDPAPRTKTRSLAAPTFSHRLKISLGNMVKATTTTLTPQRTKEVQKEEVEDVNKTSYAGNWEAGARYRYLSATVGEGRGFVAVGDGEDELEMKGYGVDTQRGWTGHGVQMDEKPEQVGTLAEVYLSCHAGRLREVIGFGYFMRSRCCECRRKKESYESRRMWEGNMYSYISLLGTLLNF